MLKVLGQYGEDMPIVVEVLTLASASEGAFGEAFSGKKWPGLVPKRP
jgi:hypothetical protein